MRSGARDKAAMLSGPRQNSLDQKAYFSATNFPLRRASVLSIPSVDAAMLGALSIAINAGRRLPFSMNS